MAADAGRKTWCLMSTRCDGCESRGRSTCGVCCLACVRHYMEAVGGGKAYCMDVMLPRMQDGAILSSEPCTACQEAGLVTSTQWTKELTSRRPKWNIERRTLTLNFRGRVSKPSSKNFQLESPETQEPKLLFGKVDEGKFVLDFSPPLGMMQAFASALTTLHWR